MNILERMNAPDEAHKAPATANLDNASDEDLRGLIERATQLLRQREGARKREAISRIKALAKEHGLNVAIEEPKRRRGRPPKKPAESPPA